MQLTTLDAYPTMHLDVMFLLEVTVRISQGKYFAICQRKRKIRWPLYRGSERALSSAKCHLQCNDW